MGWGSTRHRRLWSAALCPTLHCARRRQGQPQEPRVPARRRHCSTSRSASSRRAGRRTDGCGGRAERELFPPRSAGARSAQAALQGARDPACSQGSP